MELPDLPDSLNALSPLYLTREAELVARLAARASLPEKVSEAVSERAARLVEDAWTASPELLAAFLDEYQLDSREGWIMMTLAETLLRIPDTATADSLVNDLLTQGDWKGHLGHSSLLLVNAASMGLALGKRYVLAEDLPDAWHRMLLKLGDAIFRQALRAGIGILARQFVFGENISDALAARRPELRYSFDMLGEAALTREDAARYLEAYQQAILALGTSPSREQDLFARDSISIKVSALHPRYEYGRWSSIRGELFGTLLQLCQYARQTNIPLTIDAEESERLEISLALFEKLRRSPVLAGWDGLGLAVQAYQKRATAVVAWLRQLGEETRHRIPVRLVKGAYWDSEIKKAQQAGLPGYPVFTRKHHTDISYLACARDLLDSDHFYPQFATHNAHTLACVEYLARTAGRDCEVQRLHGMGRAVHQALSEETATPCRVYAPVGAFSTLLPYLVRRMLENGSNQSFVHQISQPGADLAKLVRDPVAKADPMFSPHPAIPEPEHLFLPRHNSRGIAMSDQSSLQDIRQALTTLKHQEQRSAPVIGGVVLTEGDVHPAYSPADLTLCLGQHYEANASHASLAMTRAENAFAFWSQQPVEERAAILEKTAELLNEHRNALLGLLIHEAGKTLPDAVAEWREAVDYCRYYAHEARRLFGEPAHLPHVTGESNVLMWAPRGVFVCISPWNFPLAIFTGQICAALVAGNTVVAKPASQTPVIGMRVVELLHQAGVPVDALHFVPGPGGLIGEALLKHRALAGVAFTGSGETAREIQKTIGLHHDAILPLIAETGGLNVMIADSSALPEQIARDAVTSAFNSAGQRCSALRVLWVQSDIADEIERLVAGSLRELTIAHPKDLSTDIGPVIDRTSLRQLEKYASDLALRAHGLGKASADSRNGLYFPPTAFRCTPDDLPDHEIFGPILHIVRYRAGELDDVLAWINRSGYGLTLGIHSRIPGTIDHIIRHARVGNIYVNRNQIGAVVGCQPFGGEGRSGTGFKAGGPHYLMRFATERCISTNLTAAGIDSGLAQLGE